ncbi:MAG: penicillin-binding protein 2 [Vallitalea sp.]|nr:penicillin-binding protein 2 [Vallitalea sp.]
MNSRESFTYKTKRNLIVLFFIFILCLLLLGCRIYSLVDKQSVNYKKKVLSQHVNETVRYNNLIEPKRGIIYDRNGRILAESKRVYKLIFDPAVLSRCKQDDIDKTVDFLVNTFTYNENDLRDLLKNKSYSNYEVLAEELNYNQIRNDYDDIVNRKYLGIHLIESYKRIYPNDNMLSDVLGFVNKNNQGSWGVEETYEDYLRGEDGREFGVINEGNYIQNKYIEAKNGNDVVLTVDQTIQYYVEQAINENLETNPKNIYVVATNPQNGEVLAMASYPNYNLNNPYDLKAYLTQEEIEKMTLEEKSVFLNRLWRNFIISDTYEPGSTYKPFVFAAALEERKVSVNNTYNCSGSKKISNINIACWKSEGHGKQTLAQALENSCNVAFMEIGQQMGKEIYYKYQHLFGFGTKTNIDLIGEGRSELHELKGIGPTELATGSFGQGFNITPLQLITSFGSLINGGYLYEPHIVKKIVNERGNIVKTTKDKIVRQAITSKTAQITKEALHTTVVDGTGKKVKIEGYDIGGKTGTAEKLPRSAEKYMVSFLGFAPVNNPQIALLVIVDEPEVKKPSSIYAQKIFKSIMEKTLPYLNVYPTINDEHENTQITNVNEINESTQSNANINSADKENNTDD